MRRSILATAVLLGFTHTLSAATFSYRGQLLEAGVAANGRYDLQFTLFADAQGRQALTRPIEAAQVIVDRGSFAVALELPELDRAHAWLEVAVKAADETAYWPLGEKESVSLKAATCPLSWELAGNAGTVPGVHFLGTTDNQPLVLRSNNQTVATFQTVDTGMFGFSANVKLGAPNNVIEPLAIDASIAGGKFNSAFDSRNVIAGGDQNRAGTDNADPNDASGATVGGGSGNFATEANSVIAGGSANRASGEQSSVGGGFSNHASALHATVAGGSSNLATALDATVAGGSNNNARGEGSVVAGGVANVAKGVSSFVAGGRSNCAGADFAWAGGRRAMVRAGSNAPGGGSCASAAPDLDGDVGTFAWADSQNADFVSTGPDQYLVRAQGGVGINAPPIVDTLEFSVTADADGSDFANLFLRQRSNTAGILISAGGASATDDNNAGFFLDHYNGTAQFRRLALNTDGSVTLRSNITAANTGVTMAANGGSWSSLSDRRLKTAVTAIDPLAVLEKLVAMPVSTWSYIAQGDDIRHMGPMAQDFAAAFALGENDTTISTIDADGVALAAIQGVNAKLERANAELRAQLETLQAQMAQLSLRLDQMQSRETR